MRKKGKPEFESGLLNNKGLEFPTVIDGYACILDFEGCPALCE